MYMNILNSTDNYRKSSTECLVIGFCLYMAVTFHNNLTEAKIANELITSVQSLNILHLSYSSKSYLISWPVVWSSLGCYRLFMSGFRFWSITRNKILLSPMLKVSTRNYNRYRSWFYWCHLSVSHEERFLLSENLTWKQLTAATSLLVCNDMRFFFGFRIFPTVNEGKC